MPLSSEQLNQLINLLASITLLEMMVAIGLGVSIGDLLRVALGLRQWRPALADRLKWPADQISMVLNLTLLSLIVFAQFDMLVGLPMRGYIGMLLLVLAGVAAGGLLGGRSNRSAMVMAT